ncbi:MAG TPA: C4-type zinc ribbon domain-containing protein [Thermodesulfobacteriota bacterium]|nr:C4-type zinc ribbon domain-containing protein [Thermodesulfobacteriota bacterium]
MTGSLKSLFEVQKIDLEIDCLIKEKGLREKGLQADEGNVSSMDTEAEKLKTELDALAANKAEKEAKLGENKERIEKDRKRINDIKNDKQYKALTKEISDAEKASKLLDMEIAVAIDKIEATKKALKEKEADIQGRKDSVKSKTIELGAKNEEFEKAVSEKKALREKLASSIDKTLFKKYETIKSKRAGIGIITVKDSICRACFMQIPPQLFIQLQRGSGELITCPHCHRILYSGT